MPVIESRITTADGLELAVYRLPVPGAKGRVLLVHGATYSGPAVWDFRPDGDADCSVMAALAAAGVEPWALEIRGYGRSQRPADGLECNSDAAQLDIAAVVQAMGEPVVLAGYSWGGYLAARYAQDHPDQVRRLVLLAPGLWAANPERRAAVTPNPGVNNYVPVRREALEKRVQLHPEDDPRILDLFARQALAHNREVPQGIFLDYRTGPPGLMVDPPRLSRLPVEILFGTDDGLYGPHVYRLFERLTSSEKSLRLFARTGHFWMVHATRHRFVRAAVEAISA